ncbi:hypothetical protein PTKIN_Ptkin06aG0115900 [Pterospermum kingtungense]
MGFVPIAQLQTQGDNTLPNHSNPHHANYSFSPSSSEPTMERQESVVGNMFGSSDYGIIDQYDRDTSVNLTAVEQLVYYEPGDIFKDMNVNNELLEEENEEHEEEEDFEEVNLETDGTTPEAPHHDLNTTFFTNIDRVDDAIAAHEIESQVKVEPSITIAALKAKVKDKFAYDVSYKKMWHAKQKAIKNVFGDWETSYRVLPRFLAALEKYNRTTVMWQFEELRDSTVGVF